ncbi:putative bifunctional diguanylate cyclase/phosphodiesterase [Rossellomorea sp. LJF3]|uniref:putative bifunctional diguanylate cyclase/phosphodiesterase n=1 Tax=Rossellomorea sp. LJF3 TaxID=3126099 RepID=UPI00300D6789
MDKNEKVVHPEVFQQLYALQHKITEMESELEKLKYYDELTGLPNLKSFKKKLKSALTSAKENKRNIAVLKIGLDRFKIVNDTLGIIKGDALLKEVASRLNSLHAEGKSLSRMNGDEFLLYIYHAEDGQILSTYCKKVLNLFQLPFIIDKHKLHMSVSIGVSIFPYAGSNVHGLIKTAHIAMCRVKEDGKNDYKIYNGKWNTSIDHQLTLENELHGALDRNEFSLVYQPQWSIKQNQLVGMEALIRWHHPRMGHISPSEFIPLAEKLGLIYTIGEWVLSEACNQNKIWQKAGLPKVRISVNISIAQLLHSQFPKTLMKILRQTSLDPQFLELEITESIAMIKEDYIFNVLDFFKTKGIHLAIDDFGTGYSSLKYLSRFPIDRLKIDQSFLHKKSPANKAIIRAIITMGHSMNLTVLAEGVEDKDQLTFLQNEHCDEFQGYFFCKPAPPEEMQALLLKYAPVYKD